MVVVEARVAPREAVIYGVDREVLYTVYNTYYNYNYEYKYREDVDTDRDWRYFSLHTRVYMQNICTYLHNSTYLQYFYILVLVLVSRSSSSSSSSQ